VNRPLLIIDRFEGDQAVLECTWADGTTSTENWPRGLLPGTAKEGDVLTISVCVDEEATAVRRRAAQEATDRLMERRR